MLHYIASFYIIAFHTDKRKNIRKLISKDKLAGETKEAQKAEKERLDRLKKKNKLKNKEESDKRIILAENPDTKEVLLEVSSITQYILVIIKCQLYLLDKAFFGT